MTPSLEGSPTKAKETVINRLTSQYENFMFISYFGMTIENNFYEFVWLTMLNQKTNVFPV